MIHTPEVIAASRMIRDDLYKRQTYLKRTLAGNPVPAPFETAETCDYRTVSGHLSPDTWRALFHCEHAWDRIDELTVAEMESLDRILDDVRASFSTELDPEMIHHVHQLPKPKNPT